MSRSLRSLHFVPAAVLALAAVACGGGDEGNPDPGGSGSVALGPDGLPIGPDGKPLPSKLDGRYELSNYFDLTSAGVFPDAANNTLKALTNFKEHPSQTMVDLLDAARVPIVPQVLSLIPTFIRDYVLGYIDEYLVKSLYKSVPFVESLTSMLDDLATITTKFELVTNLEIPVGDEIGDARGSHAFAGVAYTWQDKRTFIGAPDVVKNLGAQSVTTNAVALETRSPALETARLKLGDHRFTIPIGSFAVLAADRLAKDKFGAANLRAALGQVIDCTAVAENVSARCLTGICVGHKADIEGLCNTGLDTLITTLQDQIKRLDLPLLHMKDGAAQMWDAPAAGGALDATIDRLDHGFWTATVNVNKQEKGILATFVGRRIGDVPSKAR